ncbi:hypothetical protein E2C01_095607 [Portunus trituberculatus]|uniref:Uncharacterized protein n=1 Tax=Portunus trituberculatus TaxID=210409 RepID=A0A5B7JQ94_PORTR|nr:hypothetical protein [Portunus trituberculatus]
MMGAHSRTPKHTGDYSHLKTNRTRQCRVSPTRCRHNTGRTQNRSAAKPTTLLLEQQARCSNSQGLPVACQLLKEGTTPKPMTT